MPKKKVMGSTTPRKGGNSEHLVQELRRNIALRLRVRKTDLIRRII